MPAADLASYWTAEFTGANLTTQSRDENAFFLLAELTPA
jgi:hypothetical protein